MLNLLARIGFAALVALPVYAQAETGDAPPLPDRNPFRAKSPATAEQPAAKPALPGDQPTVAWSDDRVAAAKARLREGADGRHARLRAAAADQRGHLRRAGADPGQVDRRRSRSIRPATMTCAARERSRRLAQQDAAAGSQGRCSARKSSSCTTPPPIPAATAMAARPRRSASTRSPTRSTSPNSCSSRARR